MLSWGADFILDGDSLHAGMSRQESNSMIFDGGITPFQTNGESADRLLWPLAATPLCGDGHKNNSEECDGTDFGSASCASYGFASGTLQCSTSCTISTSSCVSAISSSSTASSGGNAPGGGRRSSSSVSSQPTHPGPSATSSSSAVSVKSSASSSAEASSLSASTSSLSSASSESSVSSQSSSSSSRIVPAGTIEEPSSPSSGFFPRAMLWVEQSIMILIVFGQNHFSLEWLTSIHILIFLRLAYIYRFEHEYEDLEAYNSKD